jgi:hypothetical protein
MKRLSLIVLFLGFTISNFANGETHNHKAHVHGAAKLMLALETETSGTIDLDCAADSIVGFEYEAKTKKDKSTRDQAFQKLRDHANSVVNFNQSLSCTVSATKVEMEKEEGNEAAAETTHGQHSDVNASFSFSCKKPLNGSTLQVGLIALFPKLKSVSLQILSNTSQTESIVKNEHDSVNIP